jgi:hypothetical protein
MILSVQLTALNMRPVKEQLLAETIRMSMSGFVRCCTRIRWTATVTASKVVDVQHVYKRAL